MNRLKMAAVMAAVAAVVAVSVASQASTTAKAETDAGFQVVEVAEAAARPCGVSSDSDGSGGWLLYWNNCWGSTGKPLAPVWSNGLGNTYVNTVCGYIPPGSTGRWHVPAANLPPEPANYTGVIYCLP